MLWPRLRPSFFELPFIAFSAELTRMSVQRHEYETWRGKGEGTHWGGRESREGREMRVTRIYVMKLSRNKFYKNIHLKLNYT